MDSLEDHPHHHLHHQEQTAAEQKCLALEIEVFKGADPNLNLQQPNPQTPKSLFKKLYSSASKVKWSNVLVLFGAHLLAVIGYYYNCTHDIKLHSVFFAAGVGLFSGEYPLIYFNFWVFVRFLGF